MINYKTLSLSILLSMSLSIIQCDIIENINSILENINTWTKPFEQRQIKDLSKTTNPLPLFKKFPILQTKLSHVTLGDFPTPIIKLKTLGKELDANNLYLKNDGISSTPFGGNKIRKLEFLLADALYNNSKTIMTVGDAGSNHATATIICANKLGLKTISMLEPQLNTSYLRRNLLLSNYFGGDIHYYPNPETKALAILQKLIEQESIDGQLPYFIPSGGSCPLGSIGFVNAAFELKEQIEKGKMPEPDYIYVTLGSCGTAAGLILGLKLANLKSKIIPVRISGTPEFKTDFLINLFNQTRNLLYSIDPTCQTVKFPADDVFINHDFAGKEYAQITKEGANAIDLLSRTEKIKIEGTYTGKTFAAMLNDLKKPEMQNKVILFWNTFCSGELKEITDKVDYKKLPYPLHRYFEEPIQTLDQGC